MIDAYNAATSITEALTRAGYTVQGPKAVRPGGASPSVTIFAATNRSFHHNPGDPLYSDEDHARSPFDVLCIYDHGGDVRAAVQAAAQLLGLDRKPTPDTARILNAAREWIRRADFSEVVPLDLQAANGYRTNDTDKAMALGCLAILEGYGKLEGPISYAQLSEATGRSLDTCAKSMRRIAPLFPCTNETTRQPDEARCYRLCEELRTSYTGYCPPSNTIPFTKYATLPMDTHRAHDAFVRSMTPLDPDELAARIEQRAKDGKRPLASGDERRRVAARIASAGPAALVALDARIEFGPMQQKHIAVLTCKSKYATSRAVGRLKGLGLVNVIDGIVHPLEDWAAWLEQITPGMPTAGTGRRRIIDRADRTIAQCEAAIKEAGQDAPQWLYRRLERAAKRKADIAADEGFTSLATVKAVGAGNHSLTWWEMSKRQHREEIHAQARMDEAEKRRAPEWELNGLARQLRLEGRHQSEIARMIEYAGYTVGEAWEAVNRTSGSERTETYGFTTRFLG